MLDITELRSEFNRNGVAFLNTELDTGLTFTDMALSADPNSEKRSRNIMNARRAYKAVLYFSRFTQFTRKQETKLERKLTRLRSALDQLGEPVSERGETAGEE